MKWRWWGRRQHGERGQAMVFVAVLMSALMATLGLAVEGGRVFVEYRHMQNAADMAALIGAQDLPCKVGDSSCVSSAQTLACTYAGNNGFSGCNAGGNDIPSANVPPVSCSPYDFMDYGNGSSNSNCKSSAAPSFYDYIEVRLKDNLGTIPIFNIPVTLTAHAVAKNRLRTGADFALITLSPTTPLNMTGSNTVNLVGSAYTNGGISGDGSQYACDGGWFSAGSISGVNSVTNGTPNFAPPNCGSTPADSPPDTQPSLPQITDPYAGSSAPPTQPVGGSFPNCPECSQNGYYYNLDTNHWYQGGNIGSGSDLELFPGVYGSFQVGNNDTVYFNPGVYTFTGGFDTNHGTMCVFGSPSCGNGNCGTSNFTSGSTAGNTWNYNCSPYGYWDSTLAAQQTSLSTTPTFYDASTGSASSTPLNGVAIYLPANSGGISEHGNSGKSNGVYLTASNPCPGTGSWSSGSVSFPYGSSSAYYSSYPSNSWGIPRRTQSPTNQIYPNVDFNLISECNNSLLDWPNEFQQPQHAHFLFFIQGPNSDILLNGANTANYTGIIYAPNSSMTLSGAGKGGGIGPPFLNGQIVVNSATLTGNSYLDLTYKACGSQSTPCGTGAGTQLVQ